MHNDAHFLVMNGVVKLMPILLLGLEDDWMSVLVRIQPTALASSEASIATSTSPSGSRSCKHGALIRVFLRPWNAYSISGFQMMDREFEAFCNACVRDNARLL